jgi:MFS family permease
MSSTKPRLPRAVFVLGWVSLFTDLSSEMIVPLLPVFLTTQLGVSASFFGLIEGLAESVASLLKLASGTWSDRMGRRFPLVLFGYSLSALMRPLMAFCTAPWQALVVRTSDRIGKGLRSAPRDALLTAATPPEIRGWAFGFHRAMDHNGAMLGALAAWLLLTAGWETKQVFMIAFLPGVLAVLSIVFGLKEEKVAPAAAATPLKFQWRSQPVGLKRYLLVLGVFTLANSSDAFLLMKAHEVGIPVAMAPMLWIVLHLTKSLTNLAGGRLSDSIGPRRTIMMGWVWYGVVYLLFGLCHQAWQVWILFTVYGLYHGLTEGAEKALVASYADKDRRGEAFGLYHALTGALALPASLWMGWVWQVWGSQAAFIISSGRAIVGFCLLLGVVRNDREDGKAA